MQKEIKYAEMSSITIPPDMLKTVDDAEMRISKINEKRNDLEAERVDLEKKISEGISKEASALVDNADTGKIASVRKRAQTRLNEVETLLQEILKLRQPALDELSEAKHKVREYINGRLAEGRVEMIRQLEAAMHERSRSLGSMKHGDFIRSTPPEKNSISRVATCEICRNEIALIKEGIVEPVHAGHFDPLPKQERLFFHPNAELKYFKCPYCDKRPWQESGKILTNRGFFMVPQEKGGIDND